MPEIKTWRRPRPFVGTKRDGTREVFKSATTPTEQSHGDTYIYTTGPFRTMRGARFMATYGENNPHCRTVDEAERIAADEAERIAARNK